MARKKKEAENAFEKGVDAAGELLEDAEKVIERIVEKAKKPVEKLGKEIVEAVEEIEGVKKKTAKKSNRKDNENEAETSEKKTAKRGAGKSKLEELKEKAKALEGKLKESDKIDIKSKVTGEEEQRQDGLVPIEEYLKSSLHLGTRVITPDMRKFVYKRRADGLAVFNTNLIDDKMREAGDYLAQFAPEDIVVVCKREAGWKAARLFGNLFGIKTFTKKYPAGSLTNPNLDEFFEAELVVICDPWLDKNAMKDANDVKIKVMAICDTNNFTDKIDFFAIGNNKSAKSLGMFFYLLAKQYAEKRKLRIEVPGIEEFVDGWAEAQIPA